MIGFWTSLVIIVVIAVTWPAAGILIAYVEYVTNTTVALVVAAILVLGIGWFLMRPWVKKGS